MSETTLGSKVASDGVNSGKSVHQSRDQKAESKGKSMGGKQSGNCSEMPGEMGSDPIGDSGTKNSGVVHGVGAASGATQRPIPVAPPLSVLLTHKDAENKGGKGKGRAKEAAKGASAPPLYPRLWEKYTEVVRGQLRLRPRDFRRSDR